MASTSYLDDLCDSIAAARSMQELAVCCKAAARLLEFEHFAMLQPSSGTRQLSGLALTDYPDDWVRHSLNNLNYLNSPVFALAARTTLPFEWRSVPALMAMSAPQKNYMREIGALGLRSGVTAPIHMPGEPSAIISFVGTTERKLVASEIAVARYLADRLFDRARRLRPAVPAGPAVGDDVTAQIVRMMFRGRSLRFMAARLDLPVREIVSRIAAARDQLAAGSDLELIARTLYPKRTLPRTHEAAPIDPASRADRSAA